MGDKIRIMNMTIKNMVKDLCGLDSKQRANYIINYLKSNNIDYQLDKYPHGVNIEVSREGEQQDKEIILFAHYDIFLKTDGANDNASSVAELFETKPKPKPRPKPHPKPQPTPTSNEKTHEMFQDLF